MRILQCVCQLHLLSDNKPCEGAECLIPNCNADDAFHKTLHGGFNIPYMLEMRKNMVHYVQCIDLYASCVVSKRAWNNEANMAAYCGSSNRLFERYVLSISDKAFMLVVLDNYSARWQAEYAIDIKKVSTCARVITLCKSNLDWQVIFVFVVDWNINVRRRGRHAGK